MKLRFCLFVLIISTALQAQNPLGFSFKDGKKFVELSFKAESNLIVVPIILNGEGPFNFILDTGSESGMIFDKWVIDENNLVNARKIPIYAKDGNKITDLLVANNLSVELTGISGAAQSMLVLKENNIDIRNILGTDAHGVLGSEIFNRFVVQVDYEAEVLRLFEPEDFVPPKGFKTFDLKVNGFRPYLEATIKQKGKQKVKVNLLVDSGASSALFLDAARNEGIHLPEKSVRHVLGSSLTGNLEGEVGRIRKLKFNKHFSFKDVVTSFPEDWEVQRELLKGGDTLTRHGTLGSDILSRFNVIFDYFHKKMYLKTTSSYNGPFKYNTTGISLSANGKELNEFFVTNVLEDSPAYREGIRVGDEIIAIGGKPIFFYSFSQINDLLRGNPGQLLKLIVRRNGELFKKSIKLRKII